MQTGSPGATLADGRFVEFVFVCVAFGALLGLNRPFNDGTARGLVRAVVRSIPIAYVPADASRFGIQTNRECRNHAATSAPRRR
jgi:hypothetical protein